MRGQPSGPVVYGLAPWHTAVALFQRERDHVVQNLPAGDVFRRRFGGDPVDHRSPLPFIQLVPVDTLPVPLRLVLRPLGGAALPRRERLPGDRGRSNASTAGGPGEDADVLRMRLHPDARPDRCRVSHDRCAYTGVLAPVVTGE
jgi:hypothetical protein